MLVEKPAGRNVAELEPLIAAARERRSPRARRLQPSLSSGAPEGARARRRGALGPLMFVRGRYGHGGRVGYDSEWRAESGAVRRRRADRSGRAPDRPGRLVSRRFTSVDGFAATYFWNMPVDDNAFLMLRTAGGQTAFLHVSCTEWKNLFSFEIYGRDGKLAIDGLGGSYGVERLDVLPDAAGDGPAGDDDLGVPARRSIVGARVRRVPRRHPARPRAVGRLSARARRARRRREDLRAVGLRFRALPGRR